MQVAFGQQDPAAAAAEAAAGFEALIGRVRAIDNEVQGLGADMPELAPQVEQIRQLLKQIVVATAKAAPQQTPQGAALPLG